MYELYVEYLDSNSENKNTTIEVSDEYYSTEENLKNCLNAFLEVVNSDGDIKKVLSVEEVFDE